MKKPQNKNKDHIPPGRYCYQFLRLKESKKPNFSMRVLPCPYWELKTDQPQQMNGYCSLFDFKDWDEEGGPGLLWDGCKECAVEFEEDDWYKRDEYGNPIGCTEKFYNKHIKWFESMLPLIEDEKQLEEVEEIIKKYKHDKENDCENRD